MNTIAIKDYILANYDSSIIQESLENLEYYKIDIIMSFPESVTGKRNVNCGEKSCSEIQDYMQNLMKKVLCYVALCFAWTIPFLFVLLHKKCKCTKNSNGY